MSKEKAPVIIYSTSWCAYCKMAVQYLASMDVPTVDKNIEDDQSAHDELMTKMGKSLSTTVGHYNNSYKELGKIDKDVVRIAGGDHQTQPELIDRPAQED